MTRRLLLTCFVLAFDNRGGFICFVLGVSILTTVSEREMNAYIDPYLGAFVYLMSWQIQLCILAMLVMDAEMTSDIGDTMVGVILLAVNLAMIAVVFFDTRNDVMRERIEVVLEQRARLVRNVTRRFSGLPDLRAMAAYHSTVDHQDTIDLENEMAVIGMERKQSVFGSANPLRQTVRLSGDDASDSTLGGQVEMQPSTVEVVAIEEDEAEVATAAAMRSASSKAVAPTRCSFVGIPNMKFNESGTEHAAVCALEGENGLVINKLTTGMKWVVRTMRMSEDRRTLVMYVSKKKVSGWW